MCFEVDEIHAWYLFRKTETSLYIENAKESDVFSSTDNILARRLVCPILVIEI